jgi:hypothetical protein
LHKPFSVYYLRKTQLAITLDITPTTCQWQFFGFQCFGLEGNMRIITGIFFLTCLAGSAWAVTAVPAPEIDTGILGMAAAAGAIYLTKRFKRG